MILKVIIVKKLGVFLILFFRVELRNIRIFFFKVQIQFFFLGCYFIIYIGYNFVYVYFSVIFGVLILGQFGCLQKVGQWLKVFFFDLFYCVFIYLWLSSLIVVLRVCRIWCLGSWVDNIFQFRVDINFSYSGGVFVLGGQWVEEGGIERMYFVFKMIFVLMVRIYQ